MLTLLDIERVLTFYDLGDLYGVTQACRGAVNETAFINTSSGRFVVRRNHRRLGESAQRYRHALINWLNERDFATPPLLTTRAGDTLLELDGRFYEIMVYVTGKDYDPERPRQLASIGATLAQYHRLVQDFPAPDESSLHRYSAQNSMALIEKLLERDIMGELYEPLTWYAQRVSQLRVTLPDTVYARLPHLLIHGDIHRDNLLFEGNEVVALLDYDQTSWDVRVTDIADALVGFATTSEKAGQMMWGVFRGPLDEARATRLVGAYNQVFPLSLAEISALPTLINLLWLQGELGRVISTPEGAPDYHQSVLDQGRLLSEWMSKHQDRLLAQWSEQSKQVEDHSREPALAA